MHPPPTHLPPAGVLRCVHPRRRRGRQRQALPAPRPPPRPWRQGRRREPICTRAGPPGLSGGLPATRARSETSRRIPQARPTRKKTLLRQFTPTPLGVCPFLADVAAPLPPPPPPPPGLLQRFLPPSASDLRCRLSPVRTRRTADAQRGRRGAGGKGRRRRGEEGADRVAPGSGFGFPGYASDEAGEGAYLDAAALRDLERARALKNSALSLLSPSPPIPLFFHKPLSRTISLEQSLFLAIFCVAGGVGRGATA